jgi:hypothetical protein
MSTITITAKAVAYGDASTGNQPLRKNFDWSRSNSVSCQNPKSSQEIIPAGSSHTFFDGTRTTSIDGTTAFAVTRDPADASRYRFTATGGTAPALRTDRNLALNGEQVTVTVNADSSVDLLLGGAATWGSTQAGDTVFIPGPTTGDAATPFGALNEGFWVVLAVLAANKLQCVRPTGTDFQASGETVTLTASTQVQAFSAAGVQAGDGVEISAAFSPTTQTSFRVDRVTSKWFEVVSTTALPLETGKTPGAAGLIFYSNLKKFVRVETNQDVALRFNGASDDKFRISPQQAGDDEQVGWAEKWGPTYSLSVVNKSSQPVTVDVFSVE